MFFGKNPSLLFPLYGIKCATFSERGEIKAMKDFSNNIFAIVDEAVSFASENIPKKLVFKAAMRTEVPIIPEMATREAIVNALIHRDYTFPSSVFLAVYPDRVVIKNPGMLPPDLSEKKLYVEHHSHPRNPLLAELAHKARYIEHWGTGTLRIISSMREAGLKDPEFRQDSGFFYVTLSFLKPELTKRQKRILALFREFDTATLSKIKQLLRERVTDRAIRKDLQMLVENGLIIKKNAGKHTTYSIILHA
jgi:ATP-dependent DNA helicase RecG